MEAVSYNLAHLLREKPSVLDLDVSAVLDGGDDRRVGRGAADATLLELLDQGAFGIARRRIGEVLGRIDVRRSEPVALMELGDGDVLVLHHHRPEHLREAVKADYLALPPELIGSGLDLNFGYVDKAVRHLAGDEPVPDELVEPDIVPIHGALGKICGPDIDMRRPYRLMRLLGILARGVVAGLLRAVLLAVV